MVYGYARTARENDGANNIANQTDALRRAGADIVYSEVCSGIQSERPVLTEMLKAMKKGDKLMAVSQDRLTRNARQFEKIIKMLKKREIELEFIKA